MSYWTECTGGDSSSCPLIDHFSNPDIEDPDGSGYATGIADERDNAEVLSTTTPTVEDFRVPEVSLSEGLGLQGRDWSSGGRSVWLGRENGDDSFAVSGEVLGDEDAWFEAEFDSMVVEFEWRFRDTPGNGDGELRVERNGNHVKTLQGGDDWETAEVTAGDGDVLRWVMAADAGDDFGAARAEVRNLRDADAENFAGTVTNTAGQPLGEVIVELDGLPMTVTGEDGAFAFPAVVDPDQDQWIEFVDSGLVPEEIALEDCSEADPCALVLEGEPRTVEGRITGMLSGETGTIDWAYQDGSGNLQTAGETPFDADASGEASVSLELDASIDYQAAGIDAAGYEEAEVALPDSMALRSGDYEDLDEDLSPRVPDLHVVEVGETSRGSFDLEVEIDPRQRQTDLVIRHGDSQESLDQQQVSTVDAGEGRETVTVTVPDLSCGNEYFWEVEAVSDHGDSGGSRGGPANTASCSSDDSFGCSMGSGEQRDPILWLLALVAVAGLFRRRRSAA